MGRATDAAGLGLRASGHPFLAAALGVAGSQDWVFAGRLTHDTAAWPADHTIGGVPVLGAATLVELAVEAGRQLGLERVEELTVDSPLALPAGSAVRLQATVGGPREADGRRRVTIHSSPAAEDRAEAAWPGHAAGYLAPAPAVDAIDTADLRTWPPTDTTSLDVAALYDALLDSRHEYAEAAQAVTGLWRKAGPDGETLYAEVVLPEGYDADADRYGLHPVLLDAAIRVLAASRLSEDGGGAPWDVVSWGGITLHGAVTGSLRVRVAVHGPASASMVIADAEGFPVATVDGIAVGPVAMAGPATRVGATDGLHRVGW